MDDHGHPWGDREAWGAFLTKIWRLDAFTGRARLELQKVSLLSVVNRAQTGAELVTMRTSVNRSAPVTQQSGKHKSVKRRMARDTTIHQAWLWFAFNTITRYGCWARDYYQSKRKTGTDCYTALRCTAQRWVKITYRIWHDRTQYDENHHQARRTARMIKKCRPRG